MRSTYQVGAAAGAFARQRQMIGSARVLARTSRANRLVAGIAHTEPASEYECGFCDGFEGRFIVPPDGLCLAEHEYLLRAG